MYLGSLYVNSFNEFGRHWQVTIQADGQLPQPGRGHQPVPGPQQAGADGPAGHAGQRCARSAARSRSRATTSTPPPPITGNVQPGVSTGDAIQTIDRLADETLPLSMKTEWTELMFMQIRAGNTAHVRLRAGGRLRLPGPGGAVRELDAAAGGHPGGAAVPALLGGRRAVHATATSTSSCRSAWWCWSGWRARTPS